MKNLRMGARVSFIVFAGVLAAFRATSLLQFFVLWFGVLASAVLLRHGIMWMAAREVDALKELGNPGINEVITNPEGRRAVTRLIAIVRTYQLFKGSIFLLAAMQLILGGLTLESVATAGLLLWIYWIF